MYTDNKHNDYTAAQLESIIERIREQDGKASCRQVGERIGRSIQGAWSMLRTHGLPTRLYSESLQLLEARIRDAASTTTAVDELYQEHGTAWANLESFKSFLYTRGIAFQSSGATTNHSIKPSAATGGTRTRGAANVQQLIEDATTRGYNTAALTILELAEMYDLTISQVRRALRVNALPYEHRKPGTAKGVKRGPRRPKIVFMYILGREGLLDDSYKLPHEINAQLLKNGEVQNPTKLGYFSKPPQTAKFQ